MHKRLFSLLRQPKTLLALSSTFATLAFAAGPLDTFKCNVFDFLQGIYGIATMVLGFGFFISVIVAILSYLYGDARYAKGAAYGVLIAVFIYGLMVAALNYSGHSLPASC